MRRPPSPLALPSYPVSGGIALLALAVTIAFWAGWDIAPLEMAPRALWLKAGAQPWRLFTSALPHGDPLHLGFDVYWLWVFGTAIEERLGHASALAICALTAAASAAAEFAVLHGGIGLSGVGYGLLGFAWVLGRYDRRFADVVDRRTVGLFLVWGVLCVVTTVLGVSRVANLAHGMGLAVGCLLGWAFGARGGRRAAAIALTALASLGSLAAAAWARPWIDLDGGALAVMGYEAVEAGRNQEGARLYRRALWLDGERRESWFNLGVAEGRLGHDAAAREAFARSCRLGDQDGCSAAGIGPGTGTGAGTGTDAGTGTGTGTDAGVGTGTGTADD
jgi:membrane associated rhomboid family serine protease